MTFLALSRGHASTSRGGSLQGGSSNASSAPLRGAGSNATAAGGASTGGTGSGIAAGGKSVGGGNQNGGNTANSSSTVSGSHTPVEQHGKLNVVGTKLVDEISNPVQLKGPSSMWLNWESQKFAEDKQGLKVMRDDWKATLVRAAMGVDTTSKTDSDYVAAPDVAKAQVNQIVQNAIDLGLYVIIDWHYDKAETRQDLAIAFFTEMATKWGAYPNVIYETYNEPLTKDWAIVKPYHEAVVAAIRAVDPDNVIVLGTPNYSQFVDLAAAKPVTGTNLMYTLHFYSCTHTQKLRDTGTAAPGAFILITPTPEAAFHDSREGPEGWKDHGSAAGERVSWRCGAPDA